MKKHTILDQIELKNALQNKEQIKQGKLIHVKTYILSKCARSVVVVIVWLLDLQLPKQSVHITTKVARSNPAHGEVYSIQHYVIKFVS